MPGRKHILPATHRRLPRHRSKTIFYADQGSKKGWNARHYRNSLRRAAAIPPRGLPSHNPTNGRSVCFPLDSQHNPWA